MTSGTKKRASVSSLDQLGTRSATPASARTTSGSICSEDALKAAGCTRIFEDRASGARSDRPGLTQALSHLRAGDTLVVWKLDRLGRTTHQLVGLLEQFERDGVKLRSLQDGIDPSTSMGKAMLQIGAVFAEMERNLIRERTRAGLSAARARGRLGGRKPKLTAADLDTVRRLMTDERLTMAEIADEDRGWTHDALSHARASCRPDAPPTRAQGQGA